MLCLQLTVALAVVVSCSSEDALVFNYEPWDVQTFEGDDEGASFKCNASSKNGDTVYYRWYFRPPNGTFTLLANGDSNEITVTKPSMADHGYYLCQAYNYMGSIQSKIAKLYVLRTSTVHFSVAVNFSLNWFALDVDNNKNEGSGSQSVNVMNRRIIRAALESALNSSNISVKIDRVDGQGSSQVQATILSICTNCNLLNYSLDTIKIKTMDLYDELNSLVNYINNRIINSEFVVAASSDSFVRMQVAMAAAGNISINCPQTMSISESHFFVCVNCGPGHYSRNSTCVPCELGLFQDQQGQTSCEQCPAGSFANSIGASECVPATSSPSSKKDNDGGIIAGVVVSVLFIVIVLVVTALSIYVIYKRYRRKKDNSTAAPTIVIENSTVLPLSNKSDDGDDNLSEIPTIRYEKPPTSHSVKQSSSHSKRRKSHESVKVTRQSQEVFKRNRSYSVAQVKKKFPNGSRIPSCYPIGEYVGSLSDNEGDMYDHIKSPSSTGRRRSMSISDLASALKESSNFSLQVPSFLDNIRAKCEPQRLNSKPKSGPPAIELDDDMTDLYDSTLRRSGRDRSNTIPTFPYPNVRLSGMKFSLSGHNDTESETKAVKRESNKSLRPVTQYVNSEIVEQHRESLASDAAGTAESPSPEQLVKFRVAQEEPTYVTMKPARGKQSLPNLGNYFAQQERPPLTKPRSLHDNPVDIELANLETQPHRNSIDINHVISDSEA